MRILDALGEELTRAAAAEEARAAARRRRRIGPFPRAVVIGIASALLLAAVAVAASLVIGRGDPIPAAPPGAVPRELQPVPGTARLNGLDVADPDGGPAWDVRTSRSRTGAVCATVGQVLDGELGIVGLDRRFHALPAGAADTCSAPQRRGATLAGARALRGNGSLTPLTVVSGVVAPGVRSAVAAGTGAKDIKMKIGPGGAFLALFRGAPEQLRPRVTLTEADGKTTTLRFADVGEYLTPDAGGGTPWTIQRVTRETAPGLTCIAAQRERGPDSPGPGTLGASTASTPPACATTGTAFAAVRRFSPVRRVQWREYYWDVQPSRTMVWGAAGRAGARVTVAAAGVRGHTVAVDPGTHGFAVVLDGSVDPRSVRVAVDGRPLAANAGVLDRRGRVLPTPVVPPWRAVAAATKGNELPGTTPWRPRRATVRIAHRAAALDGGPAWVQRTWVTRVPAAQEVGAGVDRTMTCFQVGVQRGRDVVLPLPGGATRTLGITHEGDGECAGLPALARRPLEPTVRVPLDDPSSAGARPTQVIAAGLLGPDVASATLLGAGAPRPLALDRDGAWLLVLPPAYAGRRLHVRVVREDGRVQTSETAQPPDMRPSTCGIPPAAAARVADPDGGPPWAAGTIRRPGFSCSFTARLVAGRYAYVVEDEGTVIYGPQTWSGGDATGMAPATVSLAVHGPGSGPQRTATTTSPAQIARRTLPGRTVVAGQVAPDVVSVTLRTPRDVRTVKPAHGAFLAVYDGAFYGGEVVATARRGDGSVVTVKQPAGFAVSAG